jgi:RNA polymerase sigma-70 factor (ECF subfamily)
VNRTGSEATFRQLYDRHHRAVLAYFLRRTDPETAHEATEDVYLIAWRKLDSIPPGDDALPWLYGVARRVLANHRRSLFRRIRLGNRIRHLRPLPPGEPEPQVIRRLDDEAVLAALEALPPNDQEVIRLAYWEELPHARIGDIFGCSAGAVDVRLHRAVRRLEKGLTAAGHIPDGRPAFLHGEEQT